MTDIDMLAERLAAGHYYLHAKPETIDRHAFSDYPGKKLMIEDARRFIEAARYCGLTIVEADEGR